MKVFMIMVSMMLTCLNMNAKTKEITLKWVHTSDVHGMLFCYDYLRHRHIDAGLSSVYAYTRDLQKEFGDRLILTDGGDVLQGQPTAYYYNFMDTTSTHLVADCMNQMGYVAGALGNHDVETGHAVYDRWIQDCQFPILGANVIDTQTDQPYLKPYIVIQRAGIKIAILGMLTPGIPNWLPEKLWTGLRFEEIVSSTRHWVEYIQKKEHPDLMVGLLHSGFDGGIVTKDYHENAVKQVAELVPGIDLICYGHDHKAQAQYIRNAQGDTCVVMGPTSQGYKVAEADITLTIKNGKVIRKNIKADTPSMSYTRSNECIAFEEAFADQRRTIAQWVDQPIGTFTHALHERDAYFGSSEFIDLIHQLQLDLSGADISFAAPLSFDSRIDSGEVRISDMFALYKYENFLYTMRMTGREIKNFLEMSYGLWCNQMSSPDDHILLLDYVLDKGKRLGLKNLAYNMDSAAGIRYMVDVTKPEGERISIESMADGTPFSMDAEYKVAVNSYRGNGGGELMTRGAGIPHEELASRILTSTEKDLRYYLIQRVSELGTIHPVRFNHWRFVPDEWAQPALERDRKILFPDETDDYRQH